MVHLDLTRIVVEPLFDELKQYPFFPEDLTVSREKTAKGLGAAIKAGVKDVYVVIDFDLKNESLFVVVPLADGSNEQAIRAALPEGPVQRWERWGNALVLPNAYIDLNAVRKQKPSPRPDLAAALEAAGDTAVQAVFVPPKYFARVIDETLPELPQEIGGGSSQVFTQGVLWAAAGIDLPPHPAVRVVVQSKDAVTAEALRAKLVEIMNLLTRIKGFQRTVPQYQEIFEVLTPKVEGDRLTLTLDETNLGIERSLALLTPGVEKLRARALRTASLHNLKQLGMAMHNYCDKKKQFPLPASRGPDNQSLLSWRVQILPYLGLNELYERFHLDEPWDSEHNRKLIDTMPKVFKDPSSQKGHGYTNYVLPVGNGAGFDIETPTKLKDIRDGTSHTMMIVEVDDDHAVVWTKPDDLPFDPKDPAKGLARFYAKDCFLSCFFDGSVHTIKTDLSPKTLRALFSRAGKEAIDRDL
ncbi:MAG: DUF1559 domain-containing protein [Pirellulales bacterium]|nr:DUF1559 domain-containing protein [Pirellulales bacterium]